MRKPNYQSVVFFLFAMFIFTGCTRKGSGKIANETQAEDSVYFVSESDSCKQPTAKKSLKELLFGSWTRAGDCVTWFNITEDTIYLVDELDENDNPTAVKYSVSNDSITRMFDDGEVAKDKFWFVGDTLFMENKSRGGTLCKYERIH